MAYKFITQLESLWVWDIERAVDQSYRSTTPPFAEGFSTMTWTIGGLVELIDTKSAPWVAGVVFLAWALYWVSLLGVSNVAKLMVQVVDNNRYSQDQRHP